MELKKERNGNRTRYILEVPEELVLSGKLVEGKEYEIRLFPLKSKKETAAEGI